MLSAIPTNIRLAIAAAALAAAFWGGWTAQGWRYKAQENKAWQDQVDSMRDQAKADKAKMEQIAKAREKADADAIKYRGLWAQAKRDPVTQAWGSTIHPVVVYSVLRGETVDLSSDSNPRP